MGSRAPKSPGTSGNRWVLAQTRARALLRGPGLADPKAPTFSMSFKQLPLWLGKAVLAVPRRLPSLMLRLRARRPRHSEAAKGRSFAALSRRLQDPWTCFDGLKLLASGAPRSVGSGEQHAMTARPWQIAELRASSGPMAFRCLTFLWKMHEDAT